MSRQQRTIETAFQDLLDMMSYKRPAGSKSERRFINRFIKNLPDAVVDAYGNIHIATCEKPTVLWSAHTDSVHRTPGTQKVILRTSGERSILRVAHGECLGADDGAGCWMLREMILAGVPGYYIFHREEEIGGRGSEWLARSSGDALERFQAAIAFDRRGSTSIITHQYGGRCCSDEFGLSLADIIGLNHKLDDGGSFTDTANYSEVIPECTNISIGYHAEHSKDEVLDLNYLFLLREKMIAFDQAGLVIQRDPKAIEPDSWGHTSWYSKGSTYGRFDPGLFDEWSEKPPRTIPHDDYIPRRPSSLLAMCRDYPWETSDFLEQLGVEPDLLWDHIEQLSHGVRQ